MKAFKIKLSILCLICFLLNENMSAQQFTIKPGGNQNVTLVCSCTFGPVGPWNWSQSLCSDGNPFIQNQNAMTFNIPLNTACCKVHWVASGFDGPFPTQCADDVMVLPVLSAPASVNACGSFNVSVTSGGSAGGSNCATDHGCPNATMVWSGNCGSCNAGNINGYSSIPAGSSTSPLTINANYVCNPQNPWSLDPVIINVVLPNPTINGPISIGCGSPTYPSSSDITYNVVSQPCGAGFWSWTWPSNMTPVGGVNGPSIVLHVNGPGSGNVSVQVFNTNGGSVFSGTVNKAVNVCCIPVVNETTVLNSGNTGYQVEAFSTINSTNNIQSTGTATMHAGAEVHLFPGFNAVQGSQVHLYNALCNTGFMRLLPNETTTDSSKTSTNVQPVNPTAEVLNPPLIMSQSGNKNNAISRSNENFNVMPNPSNGKFTINFNERNELPSEISVIDGFGSIIQKVEQIHKNSCTIDLSNYADGVYTIRANYYDRTENKTVIKNSK